MSEVKIARELMKEFTLTSFEALQVACQIRKNDLFQKAFLVPDNSADHPGALEAIAMALGFESNRMGFDSIPTALNHIGQMLENVVCDVTFHKGEDNIRTFDDEP